MLPNTGLPNFYHLVMMYCKSDNQIATLFFVFYHFGFNKGSMVKMSVSPFLCLLFLDAFSDDIFQEMLF